MTLIGLISDTHGLLRPQAAEALRGVDHIVHAGDVGTPGVLDGLRAIAPVTAVRGNVDRGPWAKALPPDAVVEFRGFPLYVLHILDDLSVDPAAAGIRAVVSGHTHEPLIENRENVLYVNPGSAGPRRFSLPVSVGFLSIGASGAPEAWTRALAV